MGTPVLVRSMLVVVTLEFDDSRAAPQPISHSDPVQECPKRAWAQPSTLHILSTKALMVLVFHKKNIPTSGIRKIQVFLNVFIMESGTPARRTTLHDKNIVDKMLNF